MCGADSWLLHLAVFLNKIVTTIMVSVLLTYLLHYTGHASNIDKEAF